MIVAFDADRIDHADVEFACDDHRRGHAPAGDGDDRAPAALVRAVALQAPRKGTGVAVQLVPADVKTFFMGQAVGHGRFLSSGAMGQRPDGSHRPSGPRIAAAARGLPRASPPAAYAVIVIARAL